MCGDEHRKRRRKKRRRKARPGSLYARMSRGEVRLSRSKPEATTPPPGPPVPRCLARVPAASIRPGDKVVLHPGTASEHVATVLETRRSADGLKARTDLGRWVSLSLSERVGLVSEG